MSDQDNVEPDLITWFDSQEVTDYVRFLNNKLKEAVDIMRNDEVDASEALNNKIGYVHGNLSRFNLGYKLNGNDFQLILLDPVEAFPILLGKYSANIKNRIERCRWPNYDDFVKHDYNALEGLI